MEREFLFSPEVGRSWQYPPTSEAVEALQRAGVGRLVIKSLELGNLRPGQRAHIERLGFRATLSWPSAWRRISAAERSRHAEEKFGGIVVSEVRVIEAGDRTTAPDLALTFENRRYRGDVDGDELRSRLWLRLDGKPYRVLGIIRIGGVADQIVLRHTDSVNLCELTPEESLSRVPHCAATPWCWDLPKGEHTLEVCVEGASACSAPVTFQWHAARSPMCP